MAKRHRASTSGQKSLRRVLWDENEGLDRRGLVGTFDTNSSSVIQDVGQGQIENRTKNLIRISGMFFLITTLFGCGASPKQNMNNPVFYCEIPAENTDRAVAFYSTVFEFVLERQSIDGNEMALFPYNPGSPGATGALAQGDSYKPSRDGARIYFSTSDIDATLSRAINAGGKTIYPKTDAGDYGFVAEFEDSEGNRIALHMKK